MGMLERGEGDMEVEVSRRECGQQQRFVDQKIVVAMDKS